MREVVVVGLTGCWVTTPDSMGISMGACCCTVLVSGIVTLGMVCR